MDSFGVRPFPKYTAERDNRSSQYEHEKVIKKRIEEGISYPVRSSKSLPSSSSKLVCRLEINPAEPCFRPSLASFGLLRSFFLDFFLFIPLEEVIESVQCYKKKSEKKN